MTENDIWQIIHSLELGCYAFFIMALLSGAIFTYRDKVWDEFCRQKKHKKENF